MRSAWRASPLSVGFAIVIAAASVTGFFFFRGSADQQDQTLLKSDASQASLYVGTVLAEVGSILEPVAIPVTSSDGSTAVFQERAQPLAKEGLDMALAERQGAAYVVESATGTRYSVGEVLSPALSAALAKAGDSAVAGPVTFNGKTSSAVFAVGPPLTPSGSAIFLSFSIDPSISSPITAAKPFASLKVAVYGAPKANMTNLLVATVPVSQLPLSNGSVTESTTVAGAKWVLVAEARSPLIGSFARLAPYIILGLGVFIAVLVGVTVEIVDRRQRYASALVSERTADLQSTLLDLRNAQEALIRSERLTALGEMASVVGHELRNPLAAVINALYLMRRQLGEPAAEPLEKHLAMAERETTKAASLAEDLTAFVRPREPHKENVDVPTLVEQVIQATPPPAQVALDVEVEPLSVSADRNQLAEVLTNLVTNAYQAVGSEGTVRIVARDGGGKMELSVEDDGPGIDSAIAARLFEPFFTTKHDGTGLGLAIVQRLVEAHGGTVSIDSSATDTGARVVVRLPVRDGEVTT